MTRIVFNNPTDISSCSYNGFQFPSAISSKVSFAPQYTSTTNKRIATHTKATFSITFIVTAEYLSDVSVSFGTIDSAVDPASQVYSSTSSDTVVEYLRAALQPSGKTFIFRIKGIGEDFTINPSGSVTGSSVHHDLKGGPFVSGLEIKSLFGGRVATVTWNCETHIPVCPRKVWDPNQPALNLEDLLGLTFSPQLSVGRNGRITRTIMGSWIIPVEAVGTIDTAFRRADDVVNSVIPSLFPPIGGFHREQSYKLSEDRSKVDFSITDTEIDSPTPYYPGVLSMECPLTLSGKLDEGAFNKWTCGLNMSGEVAAGWTKEILWLAFLQVIFRHFGARDLGKLDTPGEDNESFAWPTTWSMTNTLFTRKASFNFKWITLSSLSTILDATAFFDEAPLHAKGYEEYLGLGDEDAQENDPKEESDEYTESWETNEPEVIEDARVVTWRDWLRSVRNTQRPTGYTNVGILDRNADILVNFCDPLANRTINPAWKGPDIDYNDDITETSNSTYERDDENKERLVSDKTDDANATNATDPAWEAREATDEVPETPFPKEKSWVDCRMWVVITCNNRTVAHYPLGDLASSTYSTFANGETGEPVEQDITLARPTAASDTSSTPTIHAVGGPIYKAQLVGYVSRLYYPAPDPELIMVGGVRAYKTGIDQVARKDWTAQGSEGVDYSNAPTKDAVGLPFEIPHALTQGSIYKQNLTMFSKEYILDGPPGDASVASSLPRTFRFGES